MCHHGRAIIEAHILHVLNTLCFLFFRDQRDVLLHHIRGYINHFLCHHTYKGGQNPKLRHLPCRWRWYRRLWLLWQHNAAYAQCWPYRPRGGEVVTASGCCVHVYPKPGCFPDWALPCEERWVIFTRGKFWSSGIVVACWECGEGLGGSNAGRGGGHMQESVIGERAICCWRFYSVIVEWCDHFGCYMYQKFKTLQRPLLR